MVLVVLLVMSGSRRSRTCTRDTPVHPSELGLVLSEQGVDLDGLIQGVERRLITQALERTGGRKKEAARLLGITFRSLRYRLEKLELTD